MDMTPIDTRNARMLESRAVAAEPPLRTGELLTGLAYGAVLVPVLIVRVFAHLLAGQARFVGRAIRACAEELARARRA